jgi:uncharacterized membrane protein
MQPWLLASLLALGNFGLWGFFTKIAVNHIDAKSAFFYQTIGAAVVGIIGLYIMGVKPMLDVKGMSYGFLTGAAYSLGCLCYFMAASRGSIVTVVTLTALYPIVTIVLAYAILHETITIKQSLGIVFALIAMFLFAS